MSEKIEKIETEEVIKEEIEESPSEKEKNYRLRKSVEILKKLTKIDDKALEGLEIEEQFDRLSFMADHMPKTIKKSKNRPVIALPTELEEIKLGTSVNTKEGGEGVFFKSHEWLKKKKK